MAALRFFYLETLGYDPRQFVLPTLRPTHRLPEILSTDEIVRLFQAVYNRKHRVLLMTTNSAGLRVSEVVNLKLTDIHSERMMLRVEQGKGRKDRYTMFPNACSRNCAAIGRSCGHATDSSQVGTVL